MAKYKQLIGCPRCENNGRRYILGEVAPTGHILIQRTHGSNGQYRNFTIVGGNDFYLVCDFCGEKVYFKKIGKEENDKVGNFGVEWIHRESFEQTIGTVGA